MKRTPRSEIELILSRQIPALYVYSPNYWQWFTHHKNHGLLPEEIQHCQTLQDLYVYLGVDIFSRNIYADAEKYWFGGICREHTIGFEVLERDELSGKDKIMHRQYRGTGGDLSEVLVYKHDESTLVQKKFLIKDYVKEYQAFKEFVLNRSWDFDSEKYRQISKLLNDRGVVIAGEFFSPLKMLHLTMGPVNSVYFLMEYPDRAQELMEMHEHAQLDCIRQCVKNGVKVVMSMDNLDTMFHPPDYVRAYSESFYRKASSICHANDAYFFIHACGQQKANLELIASYGVDGLEGVAFPPLGDVKLQEAMKLSGPDFIITGGISAMETRNMKTKKEVFDYVEKLFTAMHPYRNRFIFSSSCNTAIDTSWETILWFRDAWMKYKNMEY